MRIFNKMKKMLLVAAASLFCVGTAFAETKTGSYAVVASDVASGAQITSVEGITLTYGTADDWTTGEGTSTVGEQSFTVYATCSATNPSPNNGKIPTAGAYVVLNPQYAGSVTVAVSNAAVNKNVYVVEDTDDNLVNGTVVIDGVETAWTSGTPCNTAAKYNSGVTFDVKAGSTYYFYLSGSKMRFNGFVYTYDDAATGDGGEVASKFDLTAYNAAVAAANEYKATLNSEDEMEAMLIMSVDDILSSAASWLAELEADAEATQADADYIATDINNNIALLKVQAEIETVRAEGQEVLALYPEETRTDNAGLVIALRNLPMMTMGYTAEQLKELVDAVKTAIPAFKLENNQLILDTAAKKANDYAATLDISEETGTMAQMEAYNTLTYYASEEVLSQIDVNSYDAVMSYSTQIDQMLAQYQPAIEKEKVVMAATTAATEAQATLDAYVGVTDEVGLADSIKVVNTILSEINMWDTEYTLEDLNTAVQKMEVAETAFIRAASEIADGTYWLKNVAADKFIAAGESWGTCAVFGEHGLDFAFAKQADGTYAIDSKLSNGGESHYFGPAGWMDAALTGWTLTKLPAGTYTLTADGANYMGYDGKNVVSVAMTDATTEAAQWMVMTKDDMIATLANGTLANPADATFFISCPNFGRNDTRFSTAWQGSPKRGGANDNMNAEKWNCTFDVYQDLTGLPNGYYTLSAQGFYRAGNGGATATDQNALLYANEVTTPLVNILTEAGKVSGASTVEGYEGTFPNSQAEASAAFTAGYYADNSLTVQVTDGTLKIGVKKDIELANDWTIFDNFELYYIGTESPEAQELAMAVDSLNTLLAEAEAWKAELNAEDATQAQVITMIDQMLTSAKAVAETPESLDQVNEMIASVYQFMATTKAQLAQMDAQAAQTLMASYENPTDNAGLGAAINKVYAVANSFVSMGEEGVIYTIADLDAAVAEMKTAQEAFVNENKPEETLVDITSEWIVNPTVNSNMDGWTSNTDAQNKALATNKVATSNGNFEGKFLENWKPSVITGEIYQEIANLPAGSYKFQISAFAESNGAAGAATVFANESTVAVNTLDASVYSVNVTLAEQGTLKIGLSVAGGANWVGIDNAKLYLLTTTTLGAEQNVLAEVVDSVAKLKAVYAEPIGVEALDAAVAAVKNTTVEECKASVTALYAAMDVFVEANEAELAWQALADSMNGANSNNPVNATAFITNPSFEDGQTWIQNGTGGGAINQPNGWKLNMKQEGWGDVCMNETAPQDGKYILNAWSGTVHSIDLSQGVRLPMGSYTLSAAMRTEWTNQVTNQHIYAVIGTDTIHSDSLKVADIMRPAGDTQGTNEAAWKTVEGWQTLTAKLVLSEETVVTIGALSNGGANSAGWFQLDNFQLVCTGNPAGELAAAVDSLNTLIAEAEAWQTTLNAEDEMHAMVLETLNAMIPAAKAVAEAPESLEAVNSMIFDVYSMLGTYKPMIEKYDAANAATAAATAAEELMASYENPTDNAGLAAAIASVKEGVELLNDMWEPITVDELNARVEAMKAAQEAFIKENKVVKTSWDFAALYEQLGNKVAMTYSDETVKVGGVDCNLGTGEYEGLAMQGAGSWFTYTSGGLYQGNGGGRKIGVLDLTAGQTVTIVANCAEDNLVLADETVATLTSVVADGDKYVHVYTMIADGTLALTLSRYYTLFSINVESPAPAKVAYLNTEGDANDAIYDALVAAGYAVDALAYADSTLTAEMIDANLVGYDVVVLGGSTGSGTNLAKTANLLVGKVNVLSTKAFWYKHYGTNGGNPGIADAPSISLTKSVATHPIFNGIEGDEFDVFVEHADERTTGRYLQSNGSFANGPEQTTLGTTNGENCIGEAWVDGKGYVIIPVDGLQPTGYLTADGEALFVNAVEYLIAGEEYVEPVVYVTEITLDQTEVELSEGASVTLVATVTPDNASDKSVTWTTSDANVVTVVDGVVTAVGAGEATITVTANDEMGVYATCTVKVEANGIEGIHADEFASPADIYDINGRLVKKAATSAEGLQKGLYIVNGKKLLVK